MNNIKLRPHHLLCISFFKGKGYSQDFVKNMTWTINLLKDDTAITFIDGADNICKACPNNTNGQCATQDKVERYDKSLLDLCNLSVGQTLTYSALKQLVDEKVLSCNKRTQICGDCEWSNICK